MKIACILTWLLPACLFIGTSASNPFLGFSYTCFNVRHIMASSIGCPLFEHSWKKNYMFRYIQKNRFILIMKWCVKKNSNIKIWGFRKCKNPKLCTYLLDYIYYSPSSGRGLIKDFHFRFTFYKEMFWYRFCYNNFKYFFSIKK